ncbi:four helix bundle protein [Aggregatimonas sangjinii]|uniref:four helix bundle protein n=1 Tax=Aggregatimonas sangjinii TaxID=2583587 RepID=UPI00293934F6|nr:four helix bundle protein [Aggregatimonas sangjinii]
MRSNIKLKKKFKFENLVIWQKAMVLGEEMDRVLERFPKKEMYNLSSQIRRAADSIALNISEGSIVQSKPEFRKFIGYSIRSLAEVVSCLYKARNRKYMTETEFDLKYDEAFNLMNMMIAFRKKI